MVENEWMEEVANEQEMGEKINNRLNRRGKIAISQ